MPIGAITYSLMYAFYQKKRLYKKQMQFKVQIGTPSLLDEEEMDDKLFQLWDGNGSHTELSFEARQHYVDSGGLGMVAQRLVYH